MRLRVRPVRTPGRYRQDRRTFRSTPHTPDRATDRADTRILRSEANERPKKTKGSHKQPLWNSSRKIPIPKQPAERPEHSAEGDRNAGFTHVRTYAVATPSGQPDLQPFRYKTRNGPSAAGIMPDAVTKRRRGSGRTGRGNEPPSKNTTNTNKKRSPASLQGSLRRRLPTLPHVTAVPSA